MTSNFDYIFKKKVDNLIPYLVPFLMRGYNLPFHPLFIIWIKSQIMGQIDPHTQFFKNNFV